ncbi:hypothetical protein CSUI_010183 [Cystoisospora suis]|uniref:Uncharacterized protein n=1 Tax=Cystoisospora suis TaxID=483139 RepID=A0A2C6JZC6_9APIC|nr:hypothetical protein CSUI_010183 [Cystoisospora suis]
METAGTPQVICPGMSRRAWISEFGSFEHRGSAMMELPHWHRKPALECGVHQGVILDRGRRGEEGPLKTIGQECGVSDRKYPERCGVSRGM